MFSYKYSYYAILITNIIKKNVSLRRNVEIHQIVATGVQNRVNMKLYETVEYQTSPVKQDQHSYCKLLGCSIARCVSFRIAVYLPTNMYIVGRSRTLLSAYHFILRLIMILHFNGRRVRRIGSRSELKFHCAHFQLSPISLIESNISRNTMNSYFPPVAVQHYRYFQP